MGSLSVRFVVGAQVDLSIEPVERGVRQVRHHGGGAVRAQGHPRTLARCEWDQVPVAGMEGLGRRSTQVGNCETKPRNPRCFDLIEGWAYRLRPSELECGKTGSPDSQVRVQRAANSFLQTLLVSETWAPGLDGADDGRRDERRGIEPGAAFRPAGSRACHFACGLRRSAV